MRVLQCIVGTYGGGAERQLCYLTAGLVRSGIETHVAICRRGPNYERLLASGAVVHELAVTNLHSPQVLGKLNRLVAKLQPDLIQTWMIQMDVVGGLVARLHRIPWILSERMGGSGLAYRSNLKHWIRSRIASNVTAIISNSLAGNAYWRRRLKPRVGNYVIPNALPLDEIAAAPVISDREAGLAGGEALILGVGRLVPQKNFASVLMALRGIFDNPKAVAVFCGEGPEQSKLEAIARSYGIQDRVIFRGYVNNTWSWMKRADVLVHVSEFEGQPNTLMEGAACGCPIVASDIPEHREFIDENSASIVNPHDVGAIERAITANISNRQVARQKAERARAKAQNWSISTMTDRYLAAYREILSGSTTRAGA